MVNVSTQLSAKMEAPYGEYSVSSARAAAPPSLVGSGAGSGQQPPAPRPSPAALPGLAGSGTCTGWRWRQEKGLWLILIEYKYICVYCLASTPLGSKKKAHARGSRAARAAGRGAAAGFTAEVEAG